MKFLEYIYLLLLVILILSACTGQAPELTKSVVIESPIPNNNATSKNIASIHVDDFEITMALIPAGKFLMGTTNGEFNTRPQHEVYLDSYYIDHTEVTNYQYSQCVKSLDCTQPLDIGSSSRPFYYGNPKFNSHPVINVTWEMALDYCKWRGARLPTEAEWEKAARGGMEDKQYPWGDQDAKCSIVNYLPKNDFCIGDTNSAASYPPNGYGLYDMAGNVWEWVADCYASDYYVTSPDKNPLGPSCTGDRVLRGGSWNDSSKFINLTHRYRYPQDHRGFGLNFFGFRCALSD